MRTDRDALDLLYADALEMYPPGPRRDAAIARLYSMASFTDCPDWQPRCTPPALKLVSTPGPSHADDQETQGEKCLKETPPGST